MQVSEEAVHGGLRGESLSTGRPFSLQDMKRSPVVGAKSRGTSTSEAGLFDEAGGIAGSRGTGLATG